MTRVSRLLLCGLPFLLAGCALHRTSAGPATPDPRFHWFAYEGSDSVFARNPAGPDQFANPVLGGFYPDPSIERVGENYYLVNSSFAYFPGVPIFHSKDLVHWAQIGNVLDRPSQLNLDSAGISRGIYAPVIRYHAGTYFMITTLVDKGGNFFVTATNPAGPWTDPVWLPSVDGIDPSFFFDDDGKAYVVNNGETIDPPQWNGHRAIWMQEFDVAAGKMVGPRKLIVNGGVDLSTKPIWIEGPHIFRKDGKYYLICAEGGTGDQHSEVVFRSDSPWGPYLPGPTNPSLTQRHLDPSRPFPVTSTGHADFVQTGSGDWWSVFLGTRPYEGDMYNTGRETFMMPVRWEGGWPVVTAGKELVPYAVKRPALPLQSANALPLSGNVRYRDEFNDASLSSAWLFIRTPRERWYDIRNGSLMLHARSADFSPNGQPSFLGRRLQNTQASASTEMTYAPSRDGEKAGLVAFQNDEYYYFLAVARVGGQLVIQVEKRAGGQRRRAARAIVASAPLHLATNAPVFLKITARGAKYDFSYGTRAGEWTELLADADGTILSTKVAGGFVGSLFGLYAFTPAP
ncbi:MAG: glycoside hydrolase family 43 protein [bacterium]